LISFKNRSHQDVTTKHELVINVSPLGHVELKG
jgi:hypothetical protein